MPPTPPGLLIIHLHLHNVPAFIPTRLNRQSIHPSEQHQKLSITEWPNKQTNNEQALREA